MLEGAESAILWIKILNLKGGYLDFSAFRV
jgi:hypothetical protein